MINGMIIDGADNVGVAIYPVKKGETIAYLDSQKHTVLRRIPKVHIEDIQIYHKFAVCDIEEDMPIVKYGQHIGRAAAFIGKGQHVHVHNVKSVREDLQ